MNQILEFVGHLLEHFTWRKAISALFVLALVCLLFILYESYTGAFLLGRIEKATRILTSLAELEADGGIQGDVTLGKIHSDLSDRLAALTGMGTSTSAAALRLTQAALAFLPWFLLSLGFLWRRKTGKDSTNAAFGGTVVISIPFVVGGALLPVAWGGLIRYLAYPWGSFAFFVFLLLVAGTLAKRRKPSG